jgi:branched-subunit amino acid transport protein AzlD
MKFSTVREILNIMFAMMYIAFTCSVEILIKKLIPGLDFYTYLVISMCMAVIFWKVIFCNKDVFIEKYKEGTMSNIVFLVLFILNILCRNYLIDTILPYIQYTLLINILYWIISIFQHLLVL